MMSMHALAGMGNHGRRRLSRRRIVLFHKEILAVQGQARLSFASIYELSCIHRTIARPFVREGGVNRFFAGIRSDTND
jgi:hypothetical protein